MANTIEDLRGHLFDTLKGLKDKTMDVERAKAVCEVSKQIVDTAKVEVAYLNVAGGCGSGFIPQGLLPGGTVPSAPTPERLTGPNGRQRQ